MLCPEVTVKVATAGNWGISSCTMPASWQRDTGASLINNIRWPTIDKIILGTVLRSSQAPCMLSLWSCLRGTALWGPGGIWPSQLELHWGCTVRSAHEDRTGVIFPSISSARRLHQETLHVGWHGLSQSCPLGLMGRPVSGVSDRGVFVVDDWQSRWDVIYVLPFGVCGWFSPGDVQSWSVHLLEWCVCAGVWLDDCREHCLHWWGSPMACCYIFTDWTMRLLDLQ